MRARNDQRRRGIEKATAQGVLARIFHGVVAMGGGLMVAAGQPEEAVLGDAEEKVIRYSVSSDLSDPITRFQKQLEANEARLRFEPRHGYLASLLQQLEVPVSSQTLVFSKTSSQAAHTSPRTPRALYYNDQIYIGWVPGGESLDIVAVDSKKGPIFYTLDQRAELSPRFVRQNECLNKCHLGSKTLNVPGLLVRSALTAPDGRPIDEIRGFVSGHNSPLALRWAGWYVTGTHAADQHLGNTLLPDARRGQAIDPQQGSNVTDLRSFFDATNYLSPHSDTVALLVLDHAVRMQNLLTQAGYETRLSREIPGAGPTDATERIARAGEALLTYLLFRDEAPLQGAVTGTTSFARDFSQAGPRDRKGRSLREFDLQKRPFRYPCSFLIYSDAFEALPQEMKDYLFQRLRQILSGEDRSGLYATLTDQDRTEVREILRETKPAFRDWSGK